MPMKGFGLAVAVSLLLWGQPWSVAAQTDPPGDSGSGDKGSESDPGDLAHEGMERLLRALNLLLEMIPQYEVPEVNEYGDIIIRRKNPLEPREDPPGEKDEEHLEERRI